MESYLLALLGGLCIGVASIGLMILNGRIAGISGIAFNALQHPATNRWAVAFLLGLVIGAFVLHSLSGKPTPVFDVPLPLILAGGLIVGFGTKLGSGCTSGHGICGIGRLSPRSVVATVTFITFGVITVFVRLHGEF